MVEFLPQLFNYAKTIDTLSFGTLSLAISPNNTYTLADVIDPLSSSCKIFQDSKVKRLSIAALSSDNASAIAFLDCLPIDNLQEITISFALPIGQYPMPQRVLESSIVRSVDFENLNEIVFDHLTNLSLSSSLTELHLTFNNIRNIAPLARALPNSNLAILDLSVNNISNISALAHVLSNSSLSYLDLGGNHISDTSSLAQALPNSLLSYLGLWHNQISNITPLAEALLESSLMVLDLVYNNNISNISPLGKALPFSSLTQLSLSGNNIRNVFPLVDALPNSYLSSLYLWEIVINDIAPLAEVLPNSSLSRLVLFRNNISDLSLLAEALPHSSLSYLGLIGNSIRNISPLSEVLPYSSLSSLDLTYSEISDISPLAEALPYSSLTELGLSSNNISDISSLAKALPYSSLTELYLDLNQIRNISALAQGLPNSNLHTISLSYNKIGNFTGLTKALIAGTKLARIDLSNNFLNDDTIILITQSLVKMPKWWNSHSWFTPFFPRERHVIADLEMTNQQLKTIILGYNLDYWNGLGYVLDYGFSKDVYDSRIANNFSIKISSQGIKSLCEILPATNLQTCFFSFKSYLSHGGLCFGTYVDDVDRSIVDPDTCYIPSTASMATPSSAFGIFFCLGLALMRLLDIV